MSEYTFREELERIRRVADMLCTAHAGLRDRYGGYASAADITVLGVSTWLVALTFVEPRLNVRLTPPGIDAQIWVGILGTITFFVSLVQVKADWKGRSDAHQRSLTMYAEVKRECGYLLAAQATINPSDALRLLARYDMATDVGIAIAEREFLKQKRRHKVKIEISKHLDCHPAASILGLRLRLWWRDNVAQRHIQQ